MALTQYQTSILELSLMQNQWSTELTPLLKNPSLKTSILNNIALASGSVNVINHRLGRKLQGWRLVRVRASATVYDTQDANNKQELTLWLNTDNDVVVDIEVF